MNSILRKLSWLVRRRGKEADLAAELQFHLEEETEDRNASGLTSDEARYAARRDLGNLALVEQDTRAVWSWTPLEQLSQDIRYALRTMFNRPAFTVLAALSLALGIGANTAIFSFMDSLLLRSLPVADPGSLVLIKWRARFDRRNSVMQGMHGTTYGDAATGVDAGILPYGAFELFHKDRSAFSSVFGRYAWNDFNLTVKGQAEVANGEFVTGDYFSGLEIVPGAGRLIVPDDDRAGAPATVVMTFALSREHFGSPAGAVGQRVLVNNVPFTVIGVTPEGFPGVEPGASPGFYLPMHAGLLLPDPRPEADWFTDQNTYWIEIMGRLRPDISLAQAQGMLAGPFQQWVESTATNDAQRANLPELTLKEGGGGLDALRHRYTKPLEILLVLVGLVLAMACANIANLLLARSSTRKREIAVRLSIGAGRLRVVRQLLTESVLLAFLGGAAGIAVAFWGIHLLTMLLATADSRYRLQADLNWHVLAATTGLCLLTGVLFGLAPAISATSVEVASALKESRSGKGRPRIKSGFIRASLGDVLICSQIAITLVLLVAAGLFTRTLSNLQGVALGFNREKVLTFHLDARKAGLRDPEIVSFYEQLRKRFESIPGVRGASLSRDPLIGHGTSSSDVIVAGDIPVPTDVLTVGPEFFHTMQISILQGRGIGERDGPGSLPVAVVNEAFARKYFASQDPIGRKVAWGHPMTSIGGVEIVGVCGNTRFGDVKDAFAPIVYVPFSQNSYVAVDEMTYELRTAVDPMGIVNTVREIVKNADPRLPLSEVASQSAEIDRSMNQEIAFARLCTAFAVLALAIACVGLYGTVSYKVARRTSELGIRMALGAQRGEIIRMVLKEVLILAAFALAMSVPAVLATTGFVRAYLFEMKPNDPIALAGAALILVSAAILAGYMPARRASRIDPMAALRHE